LRRKIVDYDGLDAHRSDVRIRPWPEVIPGGIQPELHAFSLYSSERTWMGVFGMRLAPPPPAFAELTASLFAQFGEMLAVAIENAELFEEASRAVAARDAVMAVVSHDLRSPLNSFNLSLELLRESHPDGPDRAILERMQRGVVHMNRLIEDLLDVSRIERDELKLSPSRVTVAVLLEELQSIAAPLAQAAGITLRIGQRVDAAVVADRHRVLQLLGNLVNNALKFAPKGSEVSIETRTDDGEVVFTVRDQGAGISDEDRARVFERFYRHGGNGLGLGLHISRAIVAAHGGRIWVDSAPGQGAAFSFTLRAADRA
jgi:signal transduction histidine kinase